MELACHWYNPWTCRKEICVEVDPRKRQFLEVLPGNNCGGCGFAGCSGLSQQLQREKQKLGACPVGGAPVAAKIGEIMGVSASRQIHEVAFCKMWWNM